MTLSRVLQRIDPRTIQKIRRREEWPIQLLAEHLMCSRQSLYTAIRDGVISATGSPRHILSKSVHAAWLCANLRPQQYRPANLYLQQYRPDITIRRHGSSWVVVNGCSEVLFEGHIDRCLAFRDITEESGAPQLG